MQIKKPMQHCTTISKFKFSIILSVNTKRQYILESILTKIEMMMANHFQCLQAHI